MRLVCKWTNEFASIPYFNKTIIIVEPSTNINNLNETLSKYPITSLRLQDFAGFKSTDDVSILLDNFEFNSLCIINKYFDYETTEILKLVNAMKHLKVLSTLNVYYNFIEVVMSNIEKLEEVNMNYYNIDFLYEEHLEMEFKLWESNTIQCVSLDQHSSLKRLTINCRPLSIDFFENNNSIKFFKIIAKSLEHLKFLTIREHFVELHKSDWFRSSGFKLKTLELDTFHEKQQDFDYICGREFIENHMHFRSNLPESLTNFKLIGQRKSADLVNLQLNFTKMLKLKVR